MSDSEAVAKRQRRVGGEEETSSEEAMPDGPHQQQPATASHVPHSIDLEAFAQRFSHIPVVVAYVFSFVSLHLVAALPQRLWRHVGCQITLLVMDTHDTAERRFWCGLSFSDAFEWGRRLTRLMSIVARYPSFFAIPRDGPAMRRKSPECLMHILSSVVPMVVEGHCEGQRAAAAAAGQPAGGTLESIEYSEFNTAIAIDDDESRELQRIRRRQKKGSLPPPLDPPPTLTSLTSITGIPGDEESIHGPRQPAFPGRRRKWRLPSLERVQAEWTATALGGELGDMVGASRRLKELQVHSNPDSMANTLRRLPVAEAGQPGPLSQLEDLEDVGTLTFVAMDDFISFDEWREGLGRLQTALVDRGCRSIKRFKAKFEMEPIDRRIFPTLSAIETFTRTVCVKPDIPVDIGITLSEEHLHETEYFDLSLLCDVPTRPEPSPFIQRHIQQMAAASLGAFFTIRPHHLTTPLDTPSPAAIALAESLTFTKVLDVVITEDDHVVYPEEEVQPDPVVLDHLPHNAFPAARRLIVNSREGKVMGRKIVHKMPAVTEIELRADPTSEQAVGMRRRWVGADTWSASKLSFCRVRVRGG
ncbi:unnamed protein product [Vitrella brassicaformis CCMP3155]|uniref:Uncharacterized protein n=1 Tax=Vitrella brassicaformis (strain CCMP3155) TaxID=1169540 RepID=A0A0G4ESW5_VITBC|nr:unnamed protein product [Vitrella brassicaformis CCMP3155]|eukprot:CEM01743.1 unnamed protein product [Vitrella brassicaformis CCMP3155]